ncbi:MAG: LysM peptidoglycan-binding domain-containing protein [Deltaproteobacteria bacterium]|nr:LysM peptidoglycan-binding domain-containing protein [Deltaproteobacteria bacterium]PWB62740.1 MAG: hypothetical protein C3F14_09405 [Deltaproteobacteria bacterium]
MEDGPREKLGDPRRRSRRTLGKPEDVQDRGRPRGGIHVHGGGILRRAAILAAAAFLLVGVAARGQEEERPKIYLEKKIFADISEGRKSFYEVHTVSEGENLWKILGRKFSLSPPAYPPLIKEFRRANPTVADPSRLKVGQKILLPSAPPQPVASRMPGMEGKTVPHQVEKGENLTRILKKQGISARRLPRYLEAVKEINESIRDVNRILAGATILLPTEAYFEPAREAPAVTASAAEPAEIPRELPREAPAAAVAEAPPPAVPLTRDVPREPGAEVAGPAKPEAQIRPPASPAPIAPVVEIPKEPRGEETVKKEEPAPPPAKPPYRGLLKDLLAGLGEKWADRGTLYLPVPSGGEVVINLEDYPVARFSNGTQVLIDSRGTLPRNVRALILETWKNYRVVSLDGSRDAGEIIQRLLQSSGYYSVKEGLSRPLVIGEGISVTLPARWVVLRTPESLLSGEVILIKEVPERPSGNLAAVLRYAGRVGIRVLPYATDPSALEGFLAGIDDPAEAADPPREAVPPGGLSALDFALEYLGIPKKEGDRLKIRGKGDAFQLVVQPERTFEAGGKKYVADSGRMAPALRTILKESGFTVFTVMKDEPGRGIFQRILKEAGLPSEARREFLVSGGDKEGYSVRVTGTFVTSKEWLESRKVRDVAFYGGKLHPATRTLMRDLGVEIVEW